MKTSRNRSRRSQTVLGGLCLLAAVAFTLLTLKVALDFKEGATQKPNQMPTVAAQPPASSSSPPTDPAHEADNASPEFVLRSYEGKIAVFRPDDSKPLEVLDIYVTHLPDLDIERLEAGIPVRDQDELLRYLEDFDS